jgi:hypothetical protein
MSFLNPDINEFLNVVSPLSSKARKNISSIEKQEKQPFD